MTDTARLNLTSTLQLIEVSRELKYSIYGGRASKQLLSFNIRNSR